MPALKRYPSEARARGQRGMVLISFVVAADGAALSAHISNSSGVVSLDAEGLSMVARAAPFPDALNPRLLGLVVPSRIFSKQPVVAARGVQQLN